MTRNTTWDEETEYVGSKQLVVLHAITGICMFRNKEQRLLAGWKWFQCSMHLGFKQLKPPSEELNGGRGKKKGKKKNQCSSDLEFGRRGKVFVWTCHSIKRGELRHPLAAWAEGCAFNSQKGVSGSPRVPRRRARQGSSKTKGCSVQGNITPCLSPPSWQVTLQEKDLNAKGEWDKHQYSGQKGMVPHRRQIHFPTSTSD